MTIATAHDHRRPHRGPRLARADRAHRRARLRPDAAGLSAGGVRELAASFEDGRFRSTIDMRRYRFGEGAVQVLRRAAARAHRRRAARALPAARRAGQRLGAAAGGGGRLPGRPRRLPRALPPRRPDAPDAAHPALLRGRPQHAAPGHLRRGRLPAAGRHGARPPRRGLRGRPVRAARAAPAGAVTRARDRAAARRLPALRDPPSPGAGLARLLPRDDAPRGRDGALGRRTTLGVIFHDAA